MLTSGEKYGIIIMQRIFLANVNSVAKEYPLFLLQYASCFQTARYSEIQIKCKSSKNCAQSSGGASAKVARFFILKGDM